MTRIDDRQVGKVSLSLFVLMGLLLLPGPTLAQKDAIQDGLFDVKLSYSAWDLGVGSRYVDGVDGGICPDWWPWPWPWPGPRPPRWNFRISYYDVNEEDLSRVIPLELGLVLPLSSTSRVTPYLGGGLGYYLLDGDSVKTKNELGFYGALGADIHLGSRWGLSIEGAYRQVGGDLDVDGPTFKAGLGISF